jgi:GNAT superfamily N-acetyltransferase
MTRLATVLEADAVRDLVHAAYRHYIPRIGKPPGPMPDDYVRRVAAGQVWLLEDAAGLAGILVLENGPDGLMIGNIAVDPPRRGTGCGKALMVFTEAEARRRGYSRLRLYTHALMIENLAMYRRIGFRESGRVTEQRFDRVYMVKDVVQSKSRESGSFGCESALQNQGSEQIEAGPS